MTKADIIRLRRAAVKEIMGGCCTICGYSTSQRSLHCHHIIPETKEHSIALMVATMYSLENIISELKKCVLVCANCHGEIHDGLIDEQLETSFDYAVYTEKTKLREQCKLKSCSNYILPLCFSETCSKSCATKFNIERQLVTYSETRKGTFLQDLKTHNMRTLRKVDWRTVDVLQTILDCEYNMVRAGKVLGISDNGVKRRQNKVLEELKWVL